MPNKLPVVFHEGSNSDYHFSPLECIGENSEIYKSFSVPIKKEVVKIDEDGNKSVETISYKIEFINDMSLFAMNLILSRNFILWDSFINKTCG